MEWIKHSEEEIEARIFKAIRHNINYHQHPILGVPGTYLDRKIFSQDEPFLKKAPFLSTLVANPNHIGCHTLDTSENFFSGTQEIEREVISICAENIFEAEQNSIDGYIASGGTEANIEAIWIYRNFYIEEENAKPEEILLVCSEDSHYSMHKAANLLNISIHLAKVDPKNRSILIPELEQKLLEQKKSGKKHLIFVLNLSTTLFGSIDEPKPILQLLKRIGIPYKIHIDAAFGGFLYPFTCKENHFAFRHPEITSITLDAHKMLQTPYGTGIFLIRKNYLKYVCNEKAAYVNGKDHTLIGSRSGANAIAVWMVLQVHGENGWKEKMRGIRNQTDEFCAKLLESGKVFFRQPEMNIITFPAESINPELAKKYHLVPDIWDGTPNWWKIVIMDHVGQEQLNSFLEEWNVKLKSGV